MIVDLFLKVLNLSIGALPLMAVLLVLRFIFKKAVPRKVFYIAWALVFLRLMVPFSIESDFSFFSHVPEVQVSEENIGTSIEFIKDEGETVEFPVFINPNTDNPNVDAPYHSVITGEIVTGPDITTAPTDKNLIFGTVWIFGTAALLLFGIIGYFAVLKKLKFESVAYTDKIRLSEFFKTPVVCGLVRPKIILPMNFDLDDEAKINSVISHECTHIRRGDNFWRLLATFTLYVHWFNPLVWFCYNAFIRDMEVSCDEEVLAKAKNDIRSEYAESLVALAGSGTNPLYGGVLSFGECAIKERVKCIMNFKKTTLLIVILCIAAAAALGVIFLTNPSAPALNETVETDYFKISGEKVAYLYDEEMSLEVTLENTGNKPLYISFDTEISEYSNSGWNVWFNNENYSGGAQLVAPGETSNFFGTIDFSGRTAGMTYDGRLFRIRREVFSDSELKESIGFAEWIFDIETYSGIVAVGDFGTKFVPTYSNMPKEEVFANEEQAKYCGELIDNINYEKLTQFYAVSFPSDEAYYAEISRENAIKIIHWLQEIELVTCEPKNPNTGGGYSFYIKTMDENIAVHSNGGFFTVWIEGEHQAYAFDAESCSNEFGTMWKIAQEVLEKASNEQTVVKDFSRNEFYGAISNEFEGGGNYFPYDNFLPSGQIWADSEKEKHFEDYIDGLDIENIKSFMVAFTSGGMGKTVVISKNQVKELLEVLKEVDLKTSDPINPSMGAMTSVYIFTDSFEYTVISSNESLLTVSQSGQEGVYCFDGSYDKEKFRELVMMADSILTAEGEINPAIGIPAVPTEKDPEENKYFSTNDLAVTFFDNSGKIAVSYNDPLKVVKLMDSLYEIDSAELGNLSEVFDRIELVRNSDGKKYRVSLYENGFILDGSAVSESESGKAFTLPAEEWNELCGIIREVNLDKNTIPYWLGLIHEKNIQYVYVYENGGNDTHIYPEDACFGELIDRLRGFVVPGDMAWLKNSDNIVGPDEKYVEIAIVFNNGITYNLIFTENALKTASSDMSYSLKYYTDTNGYDLFLDFATEGGPANPMTGKPVIYLYPEKETEVSVNLDFDGRLTYTYPVLNDGWKVLAKPDGTLTNFADGSTHYYLFWEGYSNREWPHEKGFVVKGSETESFLREALAKMGLTPREYNDFITYWVPRMQENEYNLISFSGDEYSEIAKLTVDPKPDSVIRIHMVWMGLDEPIDIEPQVLPTYERKGFTLVEWGGTEVFE